MLPLLWFTYTDSSIIDYSWTLSRACGTKMSKARPMRASPPHITVGKRASQLGWGLKSCCVVFWPPAVLFITRGEEGGHQMQLYHKHHCVSQRQSRTHSTADAGGHTGTGKLLCSRQTQSQEKVGKNNYFPHSKSQYLCLVKPRLNPHDQPL